MNNFNQSLSIFAPILGRILMGAFFLWHAIQASFNLPAAVAVFAQAGVPLPLLLTVISIAIEALGGIFLVVAYKTRPTALVLAVFLLLVSMFLADFVSDTQIAMFMQNMAIVGGLLYLAAR